VPTDWAGWLFDLHEGFEQTWQVGSNANPVSQTVNHQACSTLLCFAYGMFA
jgi:hypothetical protein